MAADTLQQIERAIATLSEEELAEFREWFDHYEHPFDVRIAKDLSAGRLDNAIAEALAEEQSGQTQPL